MNSITKYYTFGGKSKTIHFSSARLYIPYYFQQPKNFFCNLFLSFSSKTARYVLMDSSFNEFLLSPLQLNLVILDGSWKQQ